MKKDTTEVQVIEKKSIKSKIYCWGAFWGWTIGMIFSKVYQLWAVWFYEDGSHISHIDGWKSDSSPLWAIAYQHPQEFGVITIIFFILASLFFVRFLLKNNILKIKRDS